MLPMRDERTNEQTVKIELLSQWMLEAEFRKWGLLVTFTLVCSLKQADHPTLSEVNECGGGRVG